MRGISDHIDKIAWDTGVVRATGGAMGITSGVLMGFGLLLVPVTGGGSLALTLAGAGVGVGSAVTTLTAAICKDYHLK